MPRIVVKVGTSTLTNGTDRLHRPRLLDLVQPITRLHEADHEVLLVTSGAMAAGREQLGFPDLARSVPAKQMLSAVGQGRLMQLYSDLFDIFGVVVAQVLLTRDDLRNRTRYLNSRDTLHTLIEHRIIPIINENDTTATHEIRVGDNDNLSALVANLIEADLLVILTDQAGLFTADPRRDTAAQLIQQIEQIDAATYALAGAGSAQGTGGMVTKIQAAQLASRSGVPTVIASGREPNVLARLLAGERVGTRFEASISKVESRKRWLLAEQPDGGVIVDSGAATKLRSGGASLLPVGIIKVLNTFERGAAIAVFTEDSAEIAHGISNYGADDLRRICRAQSAQINDILGYSYGDEVIHRNNLVLLG